MLEFKLPGEADTRALGAQLGKAAMQPPLIVTLAGELGAGKTTLVRGLLQGLGYQGKVVSPTYTLMEPYSAGDLNLLHLDLYRISHPEELEFLGIRDRLADSVLLVEWPANGAGFLPQADVAVELAVSGRGRIARIQAGTPRGAALLGRVAGVGEA